MALTVLFRLLFIAYAEDRDLLPYKNNASYKVRSLKHKALELAEATSNNVPISEGEHHWLEIFQLFLSVYRGNEEWGVPAYNGTMFSSDKVVSTAGAELENLTLPNSTFEIVLRGLLLTKSENSQYAPVDFRSLSVREFGTIYEGLLESKLSLAEQNLTIDSKGTYIPANKSDDVLVKKGKIYLHNRSGARKASGSYYTPDFAVEHILDETLEPAITEHLHYLSSLHNNDARTEQFFDFRVADISMGSGHFLVAAIDRIERRFSLWLEENPMQGITDELQHLRKAANKELGSLAKKIMIEDGQLLRRMIAKRCIYGVDMNPVTVQLARLSIWIHTFVPGLPLSLLDHNLIQGNSLVGVGSLDDIRNRFDESTAGPLYKVNADALLSEASKPLRELAKLTDASVSDIAKGRKLIVQARRKTKKIKALCDLITAQPIASDPRLIEYQFENWEKQEKEVLKSAELAHAHDLLKHMSVIHFPIEFPEVFLGRDKGFNVIIGNPPWKQVKPVRRNFYIGLIPGFKGQTQRTQDEKLKDFQQNRPDLENEWRKIEEKTINLAKILKYGNYPGLGVGDLDLYKAFCWRFWHVTSRNNGKIGVVLPRSALITKGSSFFRKKLFTEAKTIDVTTLINSKKWVFEIHEQFIIALVCLSKNIVKSEGISIRGPYNSIMDYENRANKDNLKLASSEVLSWSEDAALPMIPSNYSVNVFRQLRKFPQLMHNDVKLWRARPDVQLHSTAQKPLMNFSDICPEGFWPVYKGESFDLWVPDTSDYYANADPNVVLPWLQQKRLNSHRNSKDSLYSEYKSEFIIDESTLAPLFPTIAFRKSTNSIDARTLRCALTPPNIFHADQSQVIMMPRGDKKDEAFLLGVLSSIPLDWFARRFVVLSFTFFLLNMLPIPRPNRRSKLWNQVVNISGRLACPDKRFAKWAKEVNVDYGPLDPDDKEDKIYELDAVVAHLYGLSEKQLVHIFETFRKNWDYESRLNAVLKHYRAWKKKL